MSSLARSAKHTFREQPTLNAISSLSPKNKTIGSNSARNLLQSLSELLPSKRRKDAVLCIEYLITASPEAFQKHGGHLDEYGSGYFNDALSWLRVRHGKEHILSATVHLDETTPHLVVYAVPITPDGRLSAREFLGGAKMMSAMQDQFYSVCGQRYGLSRGVKGSKAHHVRISQFYTALEEPAQPELNFRDYLAKAFGHETEAWRRAQERIRNISQQATAYHLHQKSGQFRIKALEKAEQEFRYRLQNLRKRAIELKHEIVNLASRERELAKRAPELEIAIARATAAERLLEAYQQRNHQKPEISRRKTPSLAPVFK